MVHELLVFPSTIPYSSLFFMVLKKEGTWCMCPNFWALKNLIVKDKFPIPIIDELLGELKGDQLFTKINLYQIYHQVFMK
jgi:hypothetical protein